MKRILFGASILIFTGFLFSTQIASAATVYSAGCSANTAYSITTGKKCTSTILPAGCTTTSAYSVTTGAKCQTGSVLGASASMSTDAEFAIERDIIAEPTDARCSLRTAPWIKVLSPNGGEVYQAGQQITVKWESCNINIPMNQVALNLLTTENSNTAFALTNPNTNNHYYPNVNGYNTGDVIIPNIGGIPWSFGKLFKMRVLAGYDTTIYGDDSSDDTFTINPTPQSTCIINSFTANPSIVNSGGMSTLSWNTTGCNKVGIGGSLLPTATGISTSGPHIQTTTYTLYAGTLYKGCLSFEGYSIKDGRPCSGGAQTATAVVTVTNGNTDLPPGCTSTAGYSPIIGEPCFTSQLDPTPRIAYWTGKVNQHVDVQGNWLTDPDGSSGTNIDKLTYCKKWWPNTTSVADYKTETINSWRERGNTGGPYTQAVTTTKCVQPTVPPTVCAINSFTANPNTVNVGGSSTLSWNTNCTYTGITSPQLSAGYSSSGTRDTGQLNNTTTYTLYASNTLPAGCNSMAGYSNITGAPCVNGQTQMVTVNVNSIQPGCSATTAPWIRVLSPNGGEVYQAGQQITVKWESCNSISSNVFILLQNINGSIIYLTSDPNIPTIITPNDGIETFSIPTSVYSGIVTGKYIIRVSSTINSAADESDNLFTINNVTNLPDGCTSTAGFSTTTGQPCSKPNNNPDIGPGCKAGNNFSLTTGIRCISNPVVDTIKTPITNVFKITYPNGGELFTEGQVVNIKWNKGNIPTATKIGFDLFSDTNAKEGIVLGSPNYTYEFDNDGEQDVVIPVINQVQGWTYGKTYRVHANIDVPYDTLKEESDDTFTINSTSVLPFGCTSTVGYSLATGQPCSKSNNNPDIDFGCKAGNNFSLTTGTRCIPDSIFDTVKTPTNDVRVSINSKNTEFAFTRGLKLGLRGDDVTALQNKLKEEGIYSGPVTGYFGSLTREAVKDFQKKYNISQLGIVGPQTLKVLNK